MSHLAAMSAAAVPAPIPAPQVVRTRLGPVQCLVAGDGPALLAIHGAMGGYDQSWILARALAGAAGRKVIAVSRPGYLGTSLALGASSEAQADLFAALLDALDIPAAAVAAVSAGGPSAVHFATRHPDRCRGLILMSACLDVLATPDSVLARIRLMGGLARLPGVMGLIRRRAASRADAADARTIPDPALRARTLAHRDAGPLLRALQTTILRDLPARLPGTLNDIDRYRTIAPLPFGAVRTPTLVLHARDDRVVPFAHATAAAEAIPGAALAALDAGDHGAVFTHLDEIRARAAAFL